MRIEIFIIFILFISFDLCAYTKGKTYKITVLHTNDHHGHFWVNKEGELGLAARASLIKKLRADVEKEGGHVLLLDAGDVNTGVPQSDLQQAEPDFKGMSKLGYDVMALGNHEFDNSIVTLKKQQEWAKFPFISANIYVEQTGLRLFPSHIDKKFEDLKITIFGLTTEDTPLKTSSINTKGLVFIKAYEEAIKLVPVLKEKTDILIGLTHVGHHPNESHGSDAPGDVTIAMKTKGIDLIVGGHTQKPLFKPDIVNGTIIVQAHEWGKYVGRVDLEFLDGILKLTRAELIPVNLKENGIGISQDPELVSILKPYKEKGDELIAKYNKFDLNVVLGKAEVEFIGDRNKVRFEETNLGNLITRAYRNHFQADLAVINSGGIRASIPKGVISYETLMSVLPFKGRIVTVELIGEDLKKYLAEVLLNMKPGSGSYPQFDNIETIVNKEKQKITRLLINGRPILNNKKYLVALPEFIAKGGDKYPPLDHQKHDNLDIEIVRKYILKLKELKEKEFEPTGQINYE